ncbi:MAG: alanine--tRNA ligase, partial [Muribaculaceae bacterium]|nr:alanine--tRNA ligase [Muribaculaceae bacterium]
DTLQALKKAIEENADLRRQAEDYFNEKANNLAKELLGTATIENGIKIVSMRGVRLPDLVKTVAFNVRALSPEHTAFIGATTDPSGKPLLTVMLTEDLVKSGLNASTIVREAAKSIKGGGGGQPGFAQAGGKNADGIAIASDSMRNAIK